MALCSPQRHINDRHRHGHVKRPLAVLWLMLDWLCLIGVVVGSTFVMIYGENKSRERRLRVMSGEISYGWPANSILQALSQLLVQSPVWESWVVFRTNYLASFLKRSLYMCAVMYIIRQVDGFVSCAKCLWINLLGEKHRVLLKPEHLYESSPEAELVSGSPSSSDSERRASDSDSPLPKREGDTAESVSDDWADGLWRPRVLVQVPMFNERGCYKNIIEATCKLDWPRDRLTIQILDDSTDADVRDSASAEVLKWRKSGTNILHMHRVIRSGHKAGSLKEGMAAESAKDAKFIVIFDADFIPAPDYLLQILPYFYGRPEVGLVQARWSYYNWNESMLTQYQRLTLDYHFEVDQQVMAYTTEFMNFNGTAGAWRAAAIRDSGGWKSRTTVEDMDLALRAHMRGWKFMFLNDLKVPSELPHTYEVFCRQQHRWTAGPIVLFRMMFKTILFHKKLPLWRKVHIILFFFIVRRLFALLSSFGMCALLPWTILVPEVDEPGWLVLQVPILFPAVHVIVSGVFMWRMTLLTYLMDNVTCFIKIRACKDGFFNAKRASQWVVTAKNGSGLDADAGAGASAGAGADGAPKHSTRKLYIPELTFGIYLLLGSLSSIVFLDGRHSISMLLQGTPFIIAGCDLL